VTPLHEDEHRVESVPASQRRALTWALALNGGFLVVEVAGGIVLGSLALLADAAHMVGDVAGLSIALAGTVLAGRPISARHSFGFARADVLAGHLSSLLLLGSGLWIIVEAISRLSDPEPAPIVGLGLMVVAVAGLVVNVVSAVIVHRAEGESLNMRASVAHLATDAAGSVAALLAGAAIWAFGWQWADPLASLIIAGLVLWAGVRLVGQSTHILMEGTPTGLDVTAVSAAIGAVPGVLDVHHVHLWNLTSEVAAGSAHVVLAGDPTLRETRDVADVIREDLANRFSLANVTLEFEDSRVLPAPLRKDPLP